MSRAWMKVVVVALPAACLGWSVAGAGTSAPPTPDAPDARARPTVLAQAAEAGAPAKAAGTRKAETGEASWYGPGFEGKRTASGERFDSDELTAAHPSLPLGTEAKVTNLENGRTVEVEINDRGPYADNREIDLSKAAAKRLDMVEDGEAEVKIEPKP